MWHDAVTMFSEGTCVLVIAAAVAEAAKTTATVVHKPANRALVLAHGIVLVVSTHKL